MKKLIYGAIAGATAIQVQATNAVLTLQNGSEAGLEWAAGPLETIIVNIIAFLVTFLYLIAVVLAIYGWFLILTAAGDDEKVSKWRKVIFQAVLGLIVIFLAEAIIWFVINQLFAA